MVATRWLNYIYYLANNNIEWCKLIIIICLKGNTNQEDVLKIETINRHLTKTKIKKNCEWTSNLNMMDALEKVFETYGLGIWHKWAIFRDFQENI